MKKIKYLTPILGLSAMVGVAAPIVTSCSNNTTTESTIVPTNLLRINGVTCYGFVDGTDLSKYDTIVIPEGVKIIAPYAFCDVAENAEESETDLTHITTLKLPSTIREVYTFAFAGLTNLKKVDLTSWNVDTIDFVTFADELCGETQYWAFGPKIINNLKSGHVVLPTGLPMAVEEEAKTKLQTAGIPDWWFVEQTTGHIAATPDKQQSQDAIQDKSTVYDDEPYALATNYLTLSEVFDESKYELEVHAEITKCTDEDNDFVMAWDSDIELGSDNKSITMPAVFTADEQEGDEVSYDLNIICRKVSDDSVVWTEKVPGFSLKYVYTHVESITLDAEQKAISLMLKSDLDTKVDPSTTTMKAPTIKPANAVNQAYSWSTSDDSIVSVTDAGKIQAKQFGTANITATTADGGLTDTAVVTIDTAVIGESDTLLQSNSYPVKAGANVKFGTWDLLGSAASGCAGLYDNSRTTYDRCFYFYDTTTLTPTAIQLKPENIRVTVVDPDGAARDLEPTLDYVYTQSTGQIKLKPWVEGTAVPVGVMLDAGWEIQFDVIFDDECKSVQLAFAAEAI